MIHDHFSFYTHLQTLTAHINEGLNHLYNYSIFLTSIFKSSNISEDFIKDKYFSILSLNDNIK